MILLLEQLELYDFPGGKGNHAMQLKLPGVHEQVCICSPNNVYAEVSSITFLEHTKILDQIQNRPLETLEPQSVDT